VRVFLAVVVCFLAGTEWSPAQWNIVQRDNRKYVTIENVAEFYKMRRVDTGSGRFRLAAAGRSIEGSAAGRDVLINGVKYVLCFPMLSEKGTTLISAMDVVKIIEPILRPQKIKNAAAVRTVILDAGHGGHDSGARGPYGVEKEAALDVVLRARKLLQANGFQVRLTRATDVFVPLEKRPEFGNRHPNAILVSVHFNKSSSSGATGIETYCLAPRGVPSMDEENLRYSDFVQYSGHARDPENIALATSVHAAMVRSLGLTDRGIKRARFVVIKKSAIPAILLEGGFMSGTPDARLIASPVFRQKFAQCIVDGVIRYSSAISGQLHYQRPSAVVTATDPTSVPSLAPKNPGTTDNSSSVVQAREALETATGGN
jgi:N-acetylmuramoyl-L-alanine amidase